MPEPGQRPAPAVFGLSPGRGNLLRSAPVSGRWRHPVREHRPNPERTPTPMKLKALVLAVFVAGFGASFALADDGGSGTSPTGSTTTATTTTGEKPGRDCRRAELRGALVSL